MNLKQIIMAAAVAVSGLAQAITSEEIAEALDIDSSVGMFSTRGYSDWYVDTNAVKGVTCMRSGALPGNSSDWLWSDLDLSFYAKEASYLTFKIKTHTYNNSSDSYLGIKFDSGTATVYAGDQDWKEVSIVVIPGHHVLHFGFGKRYWNNSNSGYYACLDDFKLTPISTKPSSVAVKNITCTQRYPWNGKVDIDYEVFADDPAADVWVYATGFDKDANVSMGVRAISGEGAGAPVKPGKHRMTWDVTADYPGFNSTAFTVKMTALTGGAPYMVIDLSGGVDALSYPVSYLSSVPAGGWTDEYKTTKLVLRLIPPGSFMMGSPSDEPGRDSYEDLHGVVLTKPFYIGVFELTQKQWQLVMGDTPSYYKGDARPVENVSYNTIRGTVNGAAWPTHNQVDANSFMGRLRSKVNMLFDLPTEAQWEYACRAGTSTGLNSGKQYDAGANCNEMARWQGNRNDGKGGFSQHTAVGCYFPNIWGLYDMHGNVAELCRDFWNRGLGTAGAVDPVGASKGYNWGDDRLWRGGDFSHAGVVRSAFRNSSIRCGSINSGLGFRVVCLPAE
ncbi:MAG: formylglycine-generating enzyme family protein [Kiritimatiellae bacterium]|nr:formylglycine-generating enzyme family protein [Kiritimatiellia bacterium]